MIEITNTEVWGFEGALRGMRNPMNSWDKSDSHECLGECQHCEYLDTKHIDFKECLYIGKNDLELAKKLVKAGSDHRKFMRMIHVQADVNAPLYWWKHLEQYKVGTTTNSTSTMHKIHAKEFTIDDFSHEHLISLGHLNLTGQSEKCLQNTIEVMNGYRQMFIETKDKTYWYQMIQLLPSSYNQLRTIDLNYETLFSIYHARKSHKLDEWHTFCEWIEKLPYMGDFLGLEEAENEEES